tara:strand:- start:49 stop:441 length:393 start_codon:yes stop_codon:yes gene_type:complete
MVLLSKLFQEWLFQTDLLVKWCLTHLIINQGDLLSFSTDITEDALIKNPDHYNLGSIECIEAIRESMSKEAFMGFCKGNVLKYVWRYELKGGGQDLKKAKQYIDYMLTYPENTNEDEEGNTYIVSYKYKE